MAADKREQVEEAAKAAEQAAQAAEAAAANASGNADAATQAAAQARDIADQLALIAASSPISDFVFLLTIFILAIFVGYYVVWSVTPARSSAALITWPPSTGASSNPSRVS